MFSHNGRISARQTMIILIIQMLNMGIMILPRVCTQYVGRNGYILPILAIPVGLVYLLCTSELTKKFPNATLYEITEKILTSWLARIIIYVFVIKMAIGIALELRLFGELIGEVMLSETPLEVIILVMVLSVSYLAKSGIEATVRMGEILAYFIFIPMFLVLLFISTKVDYREIMPFFQTDVTSVVIGTGIVSLWFVPLEMLLIIGGLMSKPEQAFKAGVSVVITAGIVGALFTLFTICKLGVAETLEQLWPAVTLMRSMESESGLISKQEILMIILWVFTTYLYASLTLCSSSIMLSRSFKFKRENIFVLPLMVVIYFIAILPNSLSKMYDAYLNFRFYYSIWFLLPIPLVLLVIAKIRRIGNEKKNN